MAIYSQTSSAHTVLPRCLNMASSWALITEAEVFLHHLVEMNGGKLLCSALQDVYISEPWLPPVIGNLREFCSLSFLITYVARSKDAEAFLYCLVSKEKDHVNALNDETEDIYTPHHNSHKNMQQQLRTGSRLKAPGGYNARGRLCGKPGLQRSEAEILAGQEYLFQEGLLGGGESSDDEFTAALLSKGSRKRRKRRQLPDSESDHDNLVSTTKQAPAKYSAADEEDDGAAFTIMLSTALPGRTGPRGCLSQGGNTCYLSACLQCLFHTQNFSTWREHRQCCCASRTCFSCMLESTAKATDVPGSVVNLGIWDEIIKLLQMEPRDQQDPGEFWKKFCAHWEQHPAPESLHDAANLLHAFDTTQTIQWVRHPNCACYGVDEVRGTFQGSDRFLMLPLPTEACKKTTLTDLIEQYMCAQPVQTESKEDMCGQCSTLASVWHTRHISNMERLGCLAIFLRKRGDSQNKNRCHVSLPNTLSLQGRSYKLIAAIQHCGSSAYHGHYVAWILLQHDLLLYNDAECLVFPTQNMPSFVEKNATLVVYEHR